MPPDRLLVSILRQGSYLIASIHTALDDSQLVRFQRGPDRRRSAGSGARGVVIDVAALDVLDSFGSRTLRNIAEMARLRGAVTVIVGIQPDVAFAHGAARHGHRVGGHRAGPRGGACLPRSPAGGPRTGRPVMTGADGLAARLPGRAAPLPVPPRRGDLAARPATSWAARRSPRGSACSSWSRCTTSSSLERPAGRAGADGWPDVAAAAVGVPARGAGDLRHGPAGLSPRHPVGRLTRGGDRVPPTGGGGTRPRPGARPGPAGGCRPDPGGRIRGPAGGSAGWPDR